MQKVAHSLHGNKTVISSASQVVGELPWSWGSRGRSGEELEAPATWRLCSLLRTTSQPACPLISCSIRHHQLVLFNFFTTSLS